MYRILGIIAAALTAIAAGASAQTATWKSVAPQGFDYLTGAITFPTSDTGYAVATPSSSATVETYFMTSTNAGDSWAQRTIAGVKLYDTKFITSKTGYAVGRSEGCACGALYATTDGGKNWTPRTYPATGYLASMFFVDANTGFASGANATLLKTTDGGKNWNQIAVNPAEDVNFGKIFFATPTTGYMIATLKTRLWANIIYRTTNGGAQWTKVLDEGDDTDTRPTFASMFFTSATEGYITGREGRLKVIYKTTDGGAHITKSFSAAGAIDLFSMGGIQFLNDSVGFAGGDEGTIVRTTNRGETWKRETSGVNTALPAISFFDENTGLIGGLFGALLKRTVPILPTAVLGATSLDFGKVISGSKELTFTISAANAAGLRVDSMYIQDPPGVVNGFSIVAPTGPFPVNVTQGAPLTVRVTFTPTSNGRTDVRSDLVIVTNDNAGSTFFVRLFAEQGPLPTAALSRTTLEFGDVALATSKELTLTLAAANASGLRVDSFFVQGPDAAAFSVIEPAAQFPITVAQDAPLEFTVRFTPPSTGAALRADLVIATNDAAHPESRVALSGRGTTGQSSVEQLTPTSAGAAVRVFPNPIDGIGKLFVTTHAACHTTISLYDPLGRHVARPFEGTHEPGTWSLALDATTLPAGVYYCIVDADGMIAVCTVTVAR